MLIKIVIISIIADKILYVAWGYMFKIQAARFITRPPSLY